MKYIFEDNAESDIAILFRKIYNRNKVNDFIYTNGNGNIILKLLKKF